MVAGWKIFDLSLGRGRDHGVSRIVPLTGDAKPIAIVRPPSQQSNLASYRISPDSKWVAYVSDESGQGELYITSFPGREREMARVGERWGLSRNGSGNGRELFYKNFNDEFFACAVTPKGAEMEVGTPENFVPCRQSRCLARLSTFLPMANVF